MMKNRKRLTICLVAGVLILAVSAAAAFGSVNGYSKYKEAVKALALDCDNFTADAALAMQFDGKEVLRTTGKFAVAGADRSAYTKSEINGQVSEQYDTTLNGVETWFNGEEDHYYTSERSNDSATNLMGFDKDDEMQNRLVNFMEIAADTVVGDLKNNFVQVGKEDGSTLYKVDISQSQVPSLVNAGLSLFAYSMTENADSRYNVDFENYQQTALNYYEKTSGETLSSEFKKGYMDGGDEAWYDANKAQIEKIDDVLCDDNGWEEQYYKILDQKGSGIVYVHADGSYDYYADGKAYVAAHPEMANTNLEYYVGQDMTLKNVTCTFGVDDKGNLTSNQIQVTFTTTDQDGSHHTLAVNADVTLTNYGTTTVSPLDVGNRTKQ